MVADILSEAFAAANFASELIGLGKQLEDSEIDRAQAAQLRQAARDRYDAALASLAPDIARDRAKRDTQIAALPRSAILQPPPRPAAPVAAEPPVMTTTTAPAPAQPPGGGS